MKDGNKTKAELIKELKFLREEREKGVFKDIIKRKQTEEVIQKSENRFRELFDNMSSGVAVYEAKDNGKDFIIKGFNRAAEKIEKVKKEDIIGKNVLKTFPGVKDFGLFKVFQEVYKTGKPQNHPISLYKDQRIAGWRENYIYKLPSGEIVAVYDDITERKQAVEKLKESETRIKSIFRAAPTGIGVIVNRNIQFVNKKFIEMIGYSAEELISQSARMVYPSKEEFDRVGKYKYEQIRKYGTGTIETQLLRKDGRLIDVLLSSTPIDLNDLSKGVTFTATDITERKQAGEKIKNAAIKWQTTFDAMVDAVNSIDKNGIVLQCNQSYLNLLGKTKNEILGKHCWEIVHGTNKPIDGCPFEKMKKSLHREAMLFPIGDKWFNIVVDPVFDANNNLISAVHIITDITKRKQAEEENKQKTEDLALINSLNNAVNRGDSLLEILQLLARETSKMFSSHGETVYLLSEDKKYLLMHIFSRPQAMINRIEKLIEMKIPEIRISMKSGSLYRKVLQEGQPQLINDPKNIQALMVEFTENKILKKLIPQIYKILNTHSVIDIPLYSKGEAFGLLEVSRKDPFTEVDLKRLSFISEQLISIIERKRTDEELQKSKQLLSATEQLSKTGGWEYNIQSRKLTWTDEVYQLYEVPFDYDINVEKGIAFYKPEDQQTIERYFKKVIEDGKPYDLELQFITAKGKHLWVRTIGNPVRKNGKIVKIIGNIQDITERKKAMKKIEEFAKFPTENPYPVLRISKNGTVLFQNKSSEPLLEQWQYKEGKPLKDKWLQFVRNTIEKNNINTIEIEIGDKVLLLTFAPIIEKDFVNVYGLDITQRKRSQEKLKKTLDATLDTMSKIVEAKDPYTAGHQQRVSQLATTIAKELKFSQDKIEGVRIASLIHDIGKIGLPTEILSKPGKLADIEFSLIKEHSQTGYDILKSIDFSYPVAQIVLQHHEKLNGSGYPNHLKGDKIFLEAKIICVSDVVEAMSSHRPYRPALGIDVAMEEITQNRGILYDSEVVDACLKLFKEKDFKFEIIA